MTDGEKYCTEKQPVILCILCSIDYNPSPLITADHSPPLIAANHSEYDQFCTLDVVTKSENEKAVEKKYKISKTEKSSCKVRRAEWTNWRGTSGQTGGAPRSALAAT